MPNVVSKPLHFVSCNTQGKQFGNQLFTLPKLGGNYHCWVNYNGVIIDKSPLEKEAWHGTTIYVGLDEWNTRNNEELSEQYFGCGIYTSCCRSAGGHDEFMKDMEERLKNNDYRRKNCFQNAMMVSIDIFNKTGEKVDITIGACGHKIKHGHPHIDGKHLRGRCPIYDLDYGY